MQNDPISSLDISKNLKADIKLEKHIKQELKDKPKPKEKNININSIYQIAVFLTILIIVTIFIRMSVVDMPYFDSKAEEAVEQHLQSIVAEQVAQSPDILAYERPAVAEMRYNKLLKDPETDELTKKTAMNYKSAYRDENDLNYLYGADAYFYFEQTRNLIEKGKEPAQNLPYVYAFFYKLSTFYNDQISIKQAIFYLPVIFGVLSVILLFFITRKLTNDMGGFISALFLAMNPSFLLNTRAGFIDTNSLNVLLSMLIIFLFIYTIDLRKYSIMTGILLIPSILAFKAIWNGWYYVPMILLAYIVAFFGLYILMNVIKQKDIKWISLMSAIIAIFLTISYIFTKSAYMSNILARFKLTESFFPSGFITVAELQGYSFAELSQRVGGYLIVFFVLFTIAYMLYKFYKDIKSTQDITLKSFAEQYKVRLFILVYFFSMAFVPFFAKRFTTFFVPAFCIALGAGIYFIMPQLIRFARSLQFNVNKAYLRYAFLIIISLFLILSINSTLQANMKTIPHMNDAIYNTALEIKYNSSETAKINLWWDFGYLYQAIAEREVTFHGGSFDSSRLHWVSLAFLTENENLSAGIWKMLNCKKENAAYNLLKKEMDEADAMDTLHAILPKTKQQAESYIKENNLPAKLIKYTHCESPESFIIAGSELSRKLFVLNYYANFDFRKNNDKFEMKDASDPAEHFKQKYGLTAKEARKYVNELSIYNPKDIQSVSFKSNTESCTKTDDLLLCANKYLINLSSMDASLNNMHPPAFIYFDGEVHRKEYQDSKIQYSIVVLKEDNRYKMFLINPDLDRSVLFSLLYLQGKNLENFKLFHIEKVPQQVNSYKLL